MEKVSLSTFNGVSKAAGFKTMNVSWGKEKGEVNDLVQIKMSPTIAKRIENDIKEGKIKWYGALGDGKGYISYGNINDYMTFIHDLSDRVI